MFAEMRRQNRALAPEALPAVLEKAAYGILATIGANGYPYGVPVSFVTKDGAIYFHCAPDVGQKVENLKHSAKVSFTVVGDTEVLPDKFSTKYESVIAFGEAVEVSGDVKQLALELLIQKYSQNFEAKGLKYIKAMSDKTAVYQIKVEHITGKARKK